MKTARDKVPDAFSRLSESLQRQAVTLKPTAKRTGVEAWFPYYAGYSPSFVQEVLATLGGVPGWCVLDPWNGAGTTTAVADALGCRAIGFDINPVAALVAAARLARADDASHSEGLATELLAVADRAAVAFDRGDPLSEWLSRRLVRRARAIAAAIVDLLGTRSGRRVSLMDETPPPFASFFLLCLIRAAKRFACLRDSSNPTWITAEEPGDATANALDRAFLAIAREHAADAETALKSTSRTAPSVASAIHLADARLMPLADRSVDAVVTSPPYCTRIDYFRATQFELATLGIKPLGEKYRELRERAMGTTLMRPGASTMDTDFPDAVQKLLVQVRKHPSKASDSYYVRTFQQYFADANQSLREITRVLRPGHGGVLVVQSSYYKDVAVPLGDLFVCLASAVGLKAEVVHRVPVRRVLASINSRAAKHQRHRAYTEDVVAIRKSA